MGKAWKTSLFLLCAARGSRRLRLCRLPASVAGVAGWLADRDAAVGSSGGDKGDLTWKTLIVDHACGPQAARHGVT